MQSYKGLWLNQIMSKQQPTFTNMLHHVSGEEQVAPACLLDDFIQSRFINRQLLAVPGRDTFCSKCKAASGW
jgi:hypothetical protein